MASHQTTRLDSWKEIAAYLNRDVTTVIRWEKEKSLPVHRLPGGKRQAVFAIREEIDAWLTGQLPESAPAVESTAGSGGNYTGHIPASGARWSRWAVPGLATAVVLVTTAVVVFRTGQAENASPIGTDGASAARFRPVGPVVPSFNRSDMTVPSAYTLALGDLNRNGKLDFVVTGYRTNSLYAYEGNADGAFTSRAHSPTAVKPDGVILADLDGDALLDAVTANREPNSISLLRGNGDGSFRPRVDLPVGNDPRGLTAGDFNGDGRLDLAVANSGSNSVSIVLGGEQGLRHFKDYPVGQKPYQVRVADFNNDGKLDLAVGNTNEDIPDSQPAPALFILLGVGDGTFRQHANYPVGLGSSGIAVADFNGDGELDLAIAGFEANACFFLAGKGDGAFHLPVRIPAAPAPLDVAAADIDGDGKLDLVVANAHAKSVSIFRGYGDGSFAAKLDYPVHSYPKSLAVDDFDGDGVPDILVANFLDNTISVLLNTTHR